MHNNGPVVDLIKALSEKHGGLNRVLPHAKPPTYMTVVSDSSILVEHKISGNKPRRHTIQLFFKIITM